MSSTVVPDTNDAVVALIAVAWQIVQLAASLEHGSTDAKWHTEKFDEVYKQLLKTIQSG